MLKQLKSRISHLNFTNIFIVSKGFYPLLFKIICVQLYRTHSGKTLSFFGLCWDIINEYIITVIKTE